MKIGLDSIAKSWLFRPGLDFFRPKVIHLSRGEIGSGTLTQSQSERRVEVRLEEDCYLRRSFEFPKKALRNLDQVVALKVRQSMPENGRGVATSIESVSQSDGAVRAVVLLARKGLVQSAISEGRKFGHVVAVGARDPKNTDMFFQETSRLPGQGVWFFATMALLAGYITYSFQEFQKQREDLQQQNAAVRASMLQIADRNADLEAIAENAAEDLARLSHDIGRFETDSQTLDFLAEITDALPDDVWVSDLRIDDSGFELSCFTKGEPLMVISILQSLYAIETVELAGTISYDSFSQASRFDIRGTLRQVLDD